MKYQYELIRSDRRTISVQITPEGTLRVRCPRHISTQQVEAFIFSKAAWIEKHLQKRANTPAAQPITAAQIRDLADMALQVIPERVAYYAQIMAVRYGRITIRNQRTRWGSCSSKGNLNFNCLLMLVPPRVMDYVVVHELCHLKQMNHSKAFWLLVENVLPDYKESRKWLKENGAQLIRRMNNN